MTTSVRRGGVLLCHDGSSRSDEAIRRAGSLLAPARGVALHVWLTEPATEGGQAAAEQKASSVAQAASALARDAGFDAESLSVPASKRVSDAILQTIEILRPTVVVLGSRGMSDLASAVLGSVSTSVVHESPQPVLVVPPAPTSKESV